MVIVKFNDNEFSAKTRDRCYWCQGKYWLTEEKVKKEFIEKGFTLYENVLKTPENGIENGWYDFHERLKSILGHPTALAQIKRKPPYPRR